MNLKTIIILFLLGLLVSCSMTYEKNFGVEDEDKAEEKGQHNK